MFRSLSRKARFKDLTYGIYPKVFKLASTRLGNDQDAEDVVQEAYARAFKAFDTLRDANNVEPWLVQILLNVIKDHVRRVSRQPDVIPFDDVSDDDAATLQKDADPEHKLIESEFGPDLLDALQALPEAFLSPLLLRQSYGASYQQIAEILKIPIGTVMSRLARARALLRSRLTNSSMPWQDNPQIMSPGDREDPRGKSL